MFSSTEKGIMYLEAIVVLPILIILFVFTLHLPEVHYAGLRLVDATRFYAFEKGMKKETEPSKFYSLKDEMWNFGEGEKAGGGSEKLSGELNKGNGSPFLNTFLDILDLILGSEKYTVSVQTREIEPFKKRVKLSDTLITHFYSFYSPEDVFSPPKDEDSSRTWLARAPGLLYIAMNMFGGSSNKNFASVTGMNDMLGNAGGNFKDKAGLGNSGSDPLVETGLKEEVDRLNKSGEVCSGEGK